MNAREQIETEAPPGWMVPGWFWPEIRKDAPRAFLIAGIFGLIMNAIGAPVDLTQLAGREAVWAGVFRVTLSALFIFFVAVARRRPQFTIRYYEVLVLVLLALVTVTFACLGAWIPGGFGNFYYAPLLEVELAIFVFFPMRPRKIVPAVLLANAIFLAAGVAGGHVLDNVFTNLIATFVVFLVLGLGMQHAILRARYFAFVNQRRAEWALREAETRYRKTLESTANLVFEVGAENTLRLVRAPQEIIPPAATPIDSAKILAGFHPDDYKPLFAMIDLCRADFQSRRIRARVRYDDGPWRSFEWACSFYEAADGRPAGVLLAHDITQDLELQKEIERQARLTAVGQLAAGITHDFNNALAGVRLGIDAAFAAGPLPIEAGEHLRRAADSAQKARTIIRRVLDFSKRSPTVPLPVELAAFAKESASHLRHVLGSGISVDVNAEQPAWAYIDPAQLEEVVLNLAMNAQDAMPEGGRLLLEVETLPSAVRLLISDTGAGMSEDALEHLFEPFYSTKGPNGTGLGLAQAYGLVRQNNGAIMVDSGNARGTKVIIEFPRMTAPSMVAETLAPVTVQAAGQPWRILLVDDDAALRRLFELMLTSLGARPTSAAGAQAAMQLLEAEQGAFDFVFTDQSMPATTGREFAMQVKARYPEMKILLVTGLLPEDGLLEPAPPFDGVLLKPFDVHDLRQVLLELSGTATEPQS